MLAASFRQGAAVGALGGTVAGGVHAALAVGPTLVGSAVLGATAGLIAGVLWLVTGRGVAAVTD